MSDPVERKRARGLLGLARDLLARVVERGLHLPEAAALLRGSEAPEPAPWPKPKPPLATVTLAEIYAAQGHTARALTVLDQVLEQEPEHAAARALRERIASAPVAAPVLPPEPEEQVDATSAMPAGLADAAKTPPSEVPIPMLDDEPLPERYDVDEVVLLPVDPTTAYIYWELREDSFRHAAKLPGGKVAVRVLAVSASWDGPIAVTRDVDIYASVGDWFIRELPAGAVLRAALGWLTEGDFQPLAVALEVAAPASAPSPVAATLLARYTAQGTKPLDVAAEFAPALSRALDGYRRRVAREVAAGPGAATGMLHAPPSAKDAPLGSSRTA